MTSDVSAQGSPDQAREEAPGRPPRTARGRFSAVGQAALVAGWIVVGGLALAALLRWLWWDRFEPLALFDALGPLPYVAVWPVAAAALIFRRWVLAAAAIALVGVQLAIGLPEVLAATPVPQWAQSTGAIHFRLFDANVYNGNPSMSGYAAQIRALHPDLVTLEEATPPDAIQLRADGALRGLPHQITVPQYDPFSFVVASRFPLRDARVTTVGTLPTIVSALMTVDGKTLHLLVVHTQAPVPPDWDRWADQLAAVDHAVRAIHGPLLVVGDFNATWGNRGFMQLISDGLQDAAAARGHPWQTTWSQLMGPVPPLLRIDHVLTHHGPVVTTISTGPGPGSDHRRVSADVALAG